MIKANELRVGNLVLPDFTGIKKQEPLRVTGMFIQQCSKLEEVSNYSGIPLTPEILGKAGWMLIEGEETNYRHDSLPALQIMICEDGTPVLATKEDLKNTYIILISKHCSYLHQLQNLYLALTGEELQIEL